MFTRGWILGALAILVGCGDGGKRVDASTLVGTYASVTESQCNVDLELRPNGSAVVSNKCRREDGSHGDSVVAVAAVWRVDGSVVRVEYDGASHLLDYAAAIPRSAFGGTGAGPGLKPRKEVSPAQAAVLRYGNLWKQPNPRL